MTVCILRTSLYGPGTRRTADKHLAHVNRPPPIPIPTPARARARTWSRARYRDVASLAPSRSRGRTSSAILDRRPRSASCLRNAWCWKSRPALPWRSGDAADLLDAIESRPRRRSGSTACETPSIRKTLALVRRNSRDGTRKHP